LLCAPEVRTKRETGKIYSLSLRKCFIVISSHNYANLLPFIIKDIENEKVIYLCVFQNYWNYFVVYGFEVIALDDGISPRSIHVVKKLAFNCVIKMKLTAVIKFYVSCCKITCLTIVLLSLLFMTRTQQNKCNFVQK